MNNFMNLFLLVSDIWLFINNISNVIIIGEQLELEATAQYNDSKQASYLCTLTKVRIIAHTIQY